MTGHSSCIGQRHPTRTSLFLYWTMLLLMLMMMEMSCDKAATDLSRYARHVVIVPERAWTRLGAVLFWQPVEQRVLGRYRGYNTWLPMLSIVRRATRMMAMMMALFPFGHGCCGPCCLGLAIPTTESNTATTPRPVSPCFPWHSHSHHYPMTTHLVTNSTAYHQTKNSSTTTTMMHHSYFWCYSW